MGYDIIMDIKIIENVKIQQVDRDEIKAFVEHILEELDGQILLIRLFGSCVRNELSDDSDIDIIVVVKERTLPMFDKIEDAAIDVFLKYGGRVISVKVLGEEHYNFLRKIETPFIQNIEHEGIILWKKT